MLALDQLEIRRIIIHHIPKVANRVTATAVCTDALLELPQEGLDMFSKRIAGALGSRSKGIKVDVKRSEAGSFFQRAADMMGSAVQEDRFIDESKELAQGLCDAQGIKGLAESKLLVMSGVTGEFKRPFLVVVKADMQDALAEVPGGDGKAVISYLSNIFLTEAQRLYKIGFLQQNAVRPRSDNGLMNADDYTIHLFDHLLTATETRNAAHYFYADFLGTDVAASDRQLTQDFYEKTLRFFESRQYDPEVLIEKGQDLRSELRNKEGTISVSGFAGKYLDAQDADDYEEYMTSQAFPDHAITKDVEHISNKTRRRRKFVFSSKVMITTPSDGGNLVSIESTDDGNTTVIVTGTLTKSE